MRRSGLLVDPDDPPSSARGRLPRGVCLVQYVGRILAFLLLAAVAVDGRASVPSLRGPVLVLSGPNLVAPMLAQADLKGPAKAFLDFLTIVLVLLAVCLVAAGGILISQGRYAEGLAAMVGGFICVLAVPIIYYFAKLAGVTF